MNRTGTHRPLAGLSLLEMLIVLAIVGVVAGIAAPPMSGWLASQRIRAVLDVLQRDLQHARQRAAHGNQTITICPSADGQRCQRSRDWSDGWIAFVNIDDDNPAQRDSNEKILTRHQPSRRVALLTNRYAFHFRGDLRRATNASVLACDRAAQVAPRALVLSYTGRPRIADAATLSGALTCD